MRPGPERTSGDEGHRPPKGAAPAASLPVARASPSAGIVKPENGWLLEKTPAPISYRMATLASDVTLTPSAAARVSAIAARQGKPAILRLSVEGGGCSGFQYRFGLAEAPDAGDAVAETDGVRLLVDSVSLDLVRGCSVDFVESLGGAAFRVDNPQAASGCGCGTSFAV